MCSDWGTFLHLSLRFLMYIRHSWIGVWPELTPVGSEWKKFPVLQCFPIIATEVPFVLCCACVGWIVSFFSGCVYVIVYHHQSFKRRQMTVCLPFTHSLPSHPQIKQASPVCVRWYSCCAVFVGENQAAFFCLCRRCGIKGSHLHAFCLFSWQSQISFIIDYTDKLKCLHWMR